MKVSIITVVYNNVDFLETAIQSVLSQTYKNIEYIVVDGGSEDGTLHVIDRYRDRIDQIISEPDRGIYDAMNKGIKLATGDIVGLINADDMFYDDRVVADIVCNFSEEIDCTYGNLVFVDRNDIGKVTRNWISRDFEDGLFNKSWTPAHPSFYCRKACFDKYGYYRLDFKIAADVELMYRFLQKHQLKSKYINRYMVKMRNAGISNRGLYSTITITQEVRQGMNENGGKFNLFVYLLYKAMKIRSLFFKR